MNSPLQTLKTPARRSVHSPLSEALEQFDRTAVRLGLDSGAMQLLRVPRRELRVHVPVSSGRQHDQSIRRDSRSAQRCSRTIQGRYPIPSSCRCRGRARPRDADDVEVCRRGRAARRRQGRDRCDPRNLSLAEQERLCRGWVRQMAPKSGALTRRARSRHDDVEPAHALDARRVRGDLRRQGPRFYHW